MWVQVVGGYALDDHSDGGLDGAAVFGEGEVEFGEPGGGAAAFFLGFGGDGFAGGVVEVAEVLLAEAGAGAAASVGEDVATLKARLLGVGCWLLVDCVHLVPPPGLFCSNSSKDWG